MSKLGDGVHDRCFLNVCAKNDFAILGLEYSRKLYQKMVNINLEQYIRSY